MRIERPPLSPTFELPTREQLLRINPRNAVKLLFGTERMWVRVTECADNHLWRGTLVNQPLSPEGEFGMRVEFHPLDVIAVDYRLYNGESTDDYKDLGNIRCVCCDCN